MIVYMYDPYTGIFTGETEADPDQLAPGKFLLPAHASPSEPPQAGEGERAVFKDGDWSTEVIPAPEPEPEPEPVDKDKATARAYADPIMGSDRLFLEAIRKRAAGDEEGATEAEAAGLLRVGEIKALYK